MPVSLIAFLAIMASCKKEAEKFCWETVDMFGNLTGIVCDKTEAEIQALYPNACSYFKSGGEKFCWLVNGIFFPDATQEKVNHYSRCFGLAATPAKVDCNYCGKWYHRIKRTYKPTNTFTISPVKLEQFCGDTGKTIFQGRQVIVTDTPDSLVVSQFSNNSTNW